MLSFWLALSLSWLLAKATEIKLMECGSPGVPYKGGYGPLKSRYIPGDAVHYYCDVDTHMSSNFFRRCLDNGKWSGQIPLCDDPITFSSTAQSSDKDDKSTSDLAIDGRRSTCAETAKEDEGIWSGNFTQPGKLVRIMIFLPTGPFSYEVFVVKKNGEAVWCAAYQTNRDIFGWVYHTCPGTSDVDDFGIQIQSISSAVPLRICEIAAYVLTSPNCEDPHVDIKNGRIILNRKKASLVCDKGYIKSEEDVLECIYDGKWSNKTLYCHSEDRDWEVNEKEHVIDMRRGVFFEPDAEELPSERLEF